MSWWRKLVIVIAACVLLAGIRFYTVSDIGNESIRLHLRFIGSSIYEYHAKTGYWPTRVDDLAMTTLPERSPHWRVTLGNGTDAVVWRDHLSPNPAENAGVILVYHNKGLLARLGRQWVCWGDLRTEYISTKRLKDAMAQQRAVQR